MRAAACKDDQLLLYNLTSGQPDTVVQLPPDSVGWYCCKWSEDSDIVAWEGEADFSPDSRVSVHLYQLSSGRLRSKVLLRSWGYNERLPDTRFLPAPLNAFLQLVGEPEDRYTRHLCLISLGPDGELHTETCAGKYHSFDRDGYSLAVSCDGLIACPERFDTLCIWQPGAQLCRAQAHASHLAWSPLCDMLLVDELLSLAFVDRQGIVLARQQLRLHEAPCWGPQGVVIEGGSSKHRDILFYAVLPGPSLELQHRFELPACEWPVSYLSLSSDHFAFVMGAPPLSRDDNEPAVRQLCVLKTPLARPAELQVCVTRLPPLPSASELGVAQGFSKVSWLKDGNSLLCELMTSGNEKDYKTVLVEFRG